MAAFVCLLWHNSLRRETARESMHVHAVLEYWAKNVRKYWPHQEKHSLY